MPNYQSILDLQNQFNPNSSPAISALPKAPQVSSLVSLEEDDILAAARKKALSPAPTSDLSGVFTEKGAGNKIASFLNWLGGEQGMKVMAGLQKNGYMAGGYLNEAQSAGQRQQLQKQAIQQAQAEYVKDIQKRKELEIQNNQKIAEMTQEQKNALEKQGNQQTFESGENVLNRQNALDLKNKEIQAVLPFKKSEQSVNENKLKLDVAKANQDAQNQDLQRQMESQKIAQANRSWWEKFRGKNALEFSNEAAAESANLPKGTIVTINGRTARVK